MSRNLPVIHLELDSGTFKIKTDDAIYMIEVSPNGVSPAPALPAAAERPAVQALPAGAQEMTADSFYQEISEEMFKEIGKLARDLSISIREIPAGSVQDVDIPGTGVQLEDAKGQLEDIVKLTEKATMDIMDTTESMLADCQNVHDQLGNIMNLDFVTNAPEPGEQESESGAAEAPTNEQGITFLEGLLEKQENLKALLEGIPTAQEVPEPVVEETPPAEPETRMVKEYTFEIPVIFQTMYELCTNERVKDHIKSMGAEAESAFDQASVLRAMSEIAPTLNYEDTFFDFPLSEILKVLIKFSKSERYTKILQKINQTADSIFLDTVLPIEGSIDEKEITVEPEPAAPSADQTAVISTGGLSEDEKQALLDALAASIAEISEEKERLSDEDIFGVQKGAASSDPNYSVIKNDERQTILASVEQSHQILRGIISHITKILEALSFQDLSGQRIMKIVNLLSLAQVQLLSLLVSFGTKLKKKVAESPSVSTEEAQLAQSQVDKMLEMVTPGDLDGPHSAGSLDQNTVDEMLDQLGF